MNATLKRMFCRDDGTLSMTKVGSTLVSIGGSIIAFPAAAAQAGLTVNYPSWVTLIAFGITFVGTKIGIDGMRDAITKGK